MKKLKIWDAAIRLFHWSIVILMISCFYTAYNFYETFNFSALGIQQSVSAMKLHQYSGISLFILIIFRIIWGFIGSSNARFTDFLHGPKTIICYLKTSIPPTEGHNPLGGYMVLCFIIFILLQTTTGLFLEDNTYMFGNAPLASKISGASRAYAKLIHYYAQYILMGLIALHLLAILVYALFKKQNLVGTMITGNRAFNKTHSEHPQSLKYNRPLLALVTFAIVVTTVIYFLYY